MTAGATAIVSGRSAARAAPNENSAWRIQLRHAGARTRDEPSLPLPYQHTITVIHLFDTNL